MTPEAEAYLDAPATRRELLDVASQAWSLASALFLMRHGPTNAEAIDDHIKSAHDELMKIMTKLVNAGADYPEKR